MKGFILYPTYSVEDNKAYILLYGRLENGESFSTKNYYRPYFYIESSKLSKAKKLAKFDSEGTDFKNFKGKKMSRIILDVPADVPKLRENLEKKKIECYEADIRFAYRFLFNHDLRGTVDIEGSYEKGKYTDKVYIEPKITPSTYHPELKILSLDIETSQNQKNLYSVALFSNNAQKVLMVSKEKIKNAENCQTEKELIEKLNEFIKKEDPDIITGWNLIDFDLVVLKHFYDKYEIKFSLGRSGDASKLSIEKDFFKTSKIDIHGRQALDALNLIRDPYLKDAPSVRERKFENYQLETVASELLGKKKLISKENKVEEIERQFKQDKGSLAKYNLEDAQLVYQILEKTELINLVIQRSMLTGMPIDRVNASIASLDSLYIREAIKRRIVVPTGKFSLKERGITGGYVMSSKPGIYDNILVFDFKSLYPSVMRTFNIDPYSFREKKEKNCIESPNKAYFKNEEGIIPKILERLFKERAKAKQQKKELASQAIKITMNSIFGSIASPASRFFNMKIANAITHFGQSLIKSTAKKIEEDYKCVEVIYSDTDSIFVSTSLTSSIEAEKLGRTIESQINTFYKKHIKEIYKRESKLELEFEKNYIKFLMPKIRGGEEGAKKRYAGLLKQDGKEKIDFVGLESARRDWTKASKKFQLELLNRIFHKEEVSEYVKKFVKELKDGMHDDLLIYRKAISKDLKEYTKINPQHVQAAKKLKKITSNIIEYVITTDGPEPIQNQKHKINYDHYINKQIKPIADSVLCFYNVSFDDLLRSTTQHSLFDFKSH